MNKEYYDVRKFMLDGLQFVSDQPCIPSPEVRKARLAFIQEELKELEQAFDEENIIKVYDALIDLMYVVLGTNVSCGLPPDAGWDEVHRSNMTKIVDGIIKNGKVQKGPNYQPPHLLPLIHAMYENPVKENL